MTEQERGEGIPPEEGLYFLKNNFGFFIGWYFPGTTTDPLCYYPSFRTWDMSYGTDKITSGPNGGPQEWRDFIEGLSWIRIPRPQWSQFE